MPSEYIPIFIFAILAAAFPAVTLVIFRLIRPTPPIVGAKLRPYECGVRRRELADHPRRFSHVLLSAAVEKRRARASDAARRRRSWPLTRAASRRFWTSSHSPGRRVHRKWKLRIEN